MGLMDLLNMGQPKGVQSMTELLKVRYGLLTPPKFTAFRCRWRKGEVPCTVCMEVCPREIYSGDRRTMPDWKECVHCGICAASCPDRCLAVPAFRAERFLLEEARIGALKVSCRKAETAEGLTVECAAALSMDQMAFAALGGGLVLDLRHCAGCSVERWREETERRVADLRDFLGEETFEKNVHILRQDAPASGAPGPGMSRRELFLSFRELPLDRASGSLPELPDKQDNGLLFRAMLRDRIRERAEKTASGEAKPRYRVRLPVFNDSCWHCGTCEWKCPTRALKLTNTESGILAAVQPWKCTGCGQCVGFCPEHAITGVMPMRVTNLDIAALRRIPSYPCNDCGKPRRADSPDGLCDKCRGHRTSMARKSRFEAERRAKDAAKQAPEQKR